MIRALAAVASGGAAELGDDEGDRAPPRRTQNPGAKAAVEAGADRLAPEALARILNVLPAGLAVAVIVIQHIAAEFAPSLANWLQGPSSLPVRLAREGDELKSGEVVLAGAKADLVEHEVRKYLTV